MKRLESLDILRGMDMFLLTVVWPILFFLSNTGDYGWESVMTTVFDHAVWSGFTFWDIIMPLFMFMSGVTIPFSMAKYKDGRADRAQAYLRLLRRFVLLWILGMVVQGHLLSLDWKEFKFYSNTLQAIAVGYLFSALFFLWFKPGVQIGISAALLLGFWVLMMTIGGGNFNEHGNLCETIDNAVLGAYRDQAGIGPDGLVTVKSGYTYTWILSSMNFIVTVMTGMFAGEILKNESSDEKKKMKLMLVIGAAMIAAGWLWHLQMPVIKHIWTSSMVLVSSGYCFLALLALHWLVDYRKKGKWLSVFKLWGMNALLIYVLHHSVNVGSIPESLLYGLQQFVKPEWYWFIIELGCIGIETAILKICYDRKIFIRV